MKNKLMTIIVIVVALFVIIGIILLSLNLYPHGYEEITIKSKHAKRIVAEINYIIYSQDGQSFRMDDSVDIFRTIKVGDSCKIKTQGIRFLGLYKNIIEAECVPGEVK